MADDYVREPVDCRRPLGAGAKIRYNTDMSSVFNVPILVGLGLLPSFVWLAFFIRKDVHPEPKYLITKTFLMGMIVSPLAIGLQWIFVGLGEQIQPNIFSFESPHFFLWAALVEEVVKFLAVFFIVLRNPEFDEPVDAMVYMIAASLGFAAIENILILFRFGSESGIFQGLMQLWFLRSVGATLLHALAGALIGYFLALSWFYRDHQKKLIIIGIVLASVFHFTFNALIYQEEKAIGLLGALLWLIVFGGLIQVLFRKLKERIVFGSAMEMR